jgi:PAS domain S-box-containing protein
MSKEVNQLREIIKELENENTILKQKQVEINEAKELYLKILEEFPALIWRSRLDKLCDYFNKTWLDFTGRTMEQEFGNGWTEGVHPDDLDFCLQIYIPAFDKREPFIMDYRLKNKFGEYRWIRDYGRPFYDLDKTFLGYIGSCYDITENKNNEQKLEELNATKDKFFSIIAHDLKSPFNSMLGFSKLLNDKFDKYDIEKKKDFINVINQGLQDTYKLLENLLTWSQSQRGTIDFKPEKMNLYLICQETSEMLRQSTEDKNIILINKISENTYIEADNDMISLIIRNLISNAIKFTHKGGKVLIDAKNKQQLIEITMKDNGIGIPKEIQSKLFDIGKNTSTQGTENETGTGLGLILCKEFVEKHGGEIWVESEVDKGSKFIFTLPTTM